jgi:multidrug efflux system membrane fusion protein
MQKLKMLNKNRLLIVIAGLIITVFLTSATMSNKKSSQGKEEIKPVRPVKSVIVESNETTGKRSFPALIKVAKEVDLAFRVGGPIKEFNAMVGQKFRKGETIARIDSRDFKIQILRLDAALEGARASLKAMKNGAREEDIASLTADLEAAIARLDNSKKKLARSKKLISQSFTTQSSHDQVIEQYKLATATFEASTQNLKKAKKGARREDIEVAESQIKQLNADLSAARNALEDTILKAPFDGVINKKYMESYENISSGKPIVSLLDFSTVEINTSIPEEIMLRRSFFKNMYSVIDAYPQKKIDSKLTEIGVKTASNNQSFPLTAVLNIPQGLDIKPGMTATLYIEYNLNEKEAKGYALPVAALFSDIDGNSNAWKVNSDMTISRLKLNTGPIRDEKIIVHSGLSIGDRIVTAGARFLMDGQIVRLMEATGK